MTDSNFTKTFTTDNFTQFINNTNTIGKEVGGLARLTTTVDSDLVGAINELDSDIGARPHTNLNTNTKNLTAAINEIHTAGNASLVGLTPDSANKLGGFNDSAERNTVGGALNSLSADIRTLDSDVGSSRAKTTLTTTSKNIVGSINELDAEIGDSALDSGLTGMTIRRAINALDSNHDSATTQLRTDIANSFRYTTITGDTGSDTVDSASGSLAIVGDTSLSTSVSGNRVVIDHSVTGATDVNNSGKTYVQDITMDSAGHVTAIGSTAISGLVNDDVAAGAGINAEKIADGSVSNTEFQALNGITGNIQTQLDSANSTQFFVKAGSGSTEQINNNETLTFTGSGGTSVARSGNEFTVSSTAPSNSSITINTSTTPSSTGNVTGLTGSGSFTLNGGGTTISLTGPPGTFTSILNQGNKYIYAYDGISGGWTGSSAMGVTDFPFSDPTRTFYPIRASMKWQGGTFYGQNGFSSLTYHGTGDQTLNFAYQQSTDNYAVTVGSNGLVSRYHVSTFVASPSVRSTQTRTAISISNYNITNSTQRANSMTHVIVAGNQEGMSNYPYGTG